MHASTIRIPSAPAVVAAHGAAGVVTADGEMLVLPTSRAASALGDAAPLVVHAPMTWRRLRLPPAPAFDLLELWAFVHPARPVAPTVRGLGAALDMDAPPGGLDAQAALLPEIAAALLRRLAAAAGVPRNRDAAGMAAVMGAGGWPWARAILAALGAADTQPARDPLRVWRRLPMWEQGAPPPPPSAHGVTIAEARARLAALLGPSAEQRPTQADYASAVVAAFAPRNVVGSPNLVLAEAGTGTGKTLGYVSPASLWAERNKGAVWISTYTRHLQRQVEAELARLAPDPDERRRRFVVRKGRENYLCLLKLEEAVNAGPRGATLVPLGLLARWAMATEDGDLAGGDLPGWFGELFGPAALRLADRRGECLHGGCPHWRRCYVEHTIRRARGAELVIANHALVMTQAALGSPLGGPDEAGTPTRYVFDEGHHVFDAADGAFSAELSGAETAELRRWLLGPEGGRPGPRGLRARLADLLDEPNDGAPAASPATRIDALLDAALIAARALATRDWQAALLPLEGQEPGAGNPTEAFLRTLRDHVLARASGGEPLGPGQHEVDLFPLTDALAPAAARLARALERLAEPLAQLRQRLIQRLAEDTEASEEIRGTLDGMAGAIQRRALGPLAAWRTMLDTLLDPSPPEPGATPRYIHLVRLDRRGDADHDAALARHWLDPTIPFALTLAAGAHGLLVTSATLRDAGDAAADAATAWSAAEARVGAGHLPLPAIRAAVPSPFDYAAQTRAFVVTDLGMGIASLAGAYAALFQAAGGGALGLFTAISRLRAVHERIAAPLEAAGLPLLAQHVDAMDNATLVDIFRAEENSCLLGTDAMRDGVDVPGRALRLVVFERVPWPRPDILHRERRVHLSGGDPKGYDDRIARLRLRQAFGRLIRARTDRGVFVLLDRQTPSRLLSAFPDGAVPRRLGLAAALAETAAFLQG